MSRGKQSKEAEAIDDPFVSLHAIPARKNDHQCNSHHFIGSRGVIRIQSAENVGFSHIEFVASLCKELDRVAVSW